METSPQLYAMAMSENQENQMDTEMTSPAETTTKSNATSQGVSWSDFEWKSYGTQMSVSMDATPSVTGV